MNTPFEHRALAPKPNVQGQQLGVAQRRQFETVPLLPIMTRSLPWCRGEGMGKRWHCVRVSHHGGSQEPNVVGGLTSRGLARKGETLKEKHLDKTEGISLLLPINLLKLPKVTSK